MGCRDGGMLDCTVAQERRRARGRVRLTALSVKRPSRVADSSMPEPWEVHTWLDSTFVQITAAQGVMEVGQVYALDKWGRVRKHVRALIRADEPAAMSVRVDGERQAPDLRSTLSGGASMVGARKGRKTVGIIPSDPPIFN